MDRFLAPCGAKLAVSGNNCARPAQKQGAKLNIEHDAVERAGRTKVEHALFMLLVKMHQKHNENSQRPQE
jgi:hypothetical protein